MTFLVKGSDAALLSAALTDLVHRLVGTGDRTLMVDEFGGFDGVEGELTAAVDAAQTPPFLTDRRIVVIRDLGTVKADDLAPLIAYLKDPLPQTTLVLASATALPKRFMDAFKAAGGEQIDTDPGTTGKQRQAWFDEQLTGIGVKFDAGARTALMSHLGEDVGRLAAIIETLEATFGAGARLTEHDVLPYLGDGGGVPPWELTDAIDKGDMALALERVQRMMRGGGRHPLQIMATLQAHYGRMLRLDGAVLDSGAPVTNEKQAAEVLGIKGSTFPAKKALDQVRRIGHSGVSRAITLLADADLDLRGRRQLPEQLVMEVLVARLCRVGGGRR